MDAIKTLRLLIILMPFMALGQKTIYPKDTIYVKYDLKSGSKKKNTSYSLGGEIKNGKYIDHAKQGIAFNLKDEDNRSMLLFYDKENKPDTLDMVYLKAYKTLNLKKIDRKERQYYKNRFGRYPWIKNKNGVFQTYLIEVISKEQFVIYPVIWRNEGTID